MAVDAVSRRDLKEMLKNLAGFLKVPARRYWIDYDEEADVLYLGFRKPQRATDSQLLEEGVIVRKAGGRVVGLTILNASSRRK
jgi:uncharacterized protein YuzE